MDPPCVVCGSTHSFDTDPLIICGCASCIAHPETAKAVHLLHTDDGGVYYLAPVYLATTLLGMAGLVLLLPTFFDLLRSW